MKNSLPSFLLLLCLFGVGCGQGSGGGPVAPEGLQSNNGGGGGGGGNQLPTASARLSIRTSQALAGGTVASAENSGANRILALFSSPAFAQTFFTLPGARVDALGTTFAIANQSGVAQFLTLPPRDYQFVVSTSEPQVVLQTLLIAEPGRELSDQIDEFTSMATITAASAARSLGTIAASADLRALTQLFRTGGHSQFAAVRSLVETNLAGHQAWLDNTDFLPLSNSPLEQAVSAANQAVTYRVAQVPFTGQVDYPVSPLLLAITFNRAVDPTTLPSLSHSGWTLQTPQGPINAANLSQFGVVNYSQSAATLDGRVILPNTLYFRLEGFPAAAGTRQSFSLSLASLPKDAQGHDILSSRPASSFVDWSFYAFGTGQPGAQVDSNATGSLGYQASLCDGPSNANLSPIAPPSLLLAFATPSRFDFLYQQVEQPFRIPSTERVFQLEVRDSDTIQVGEVYTFSTQPSEVSLSYEERDYLPGEAGKMNTRRFVAESGTARVTRIQTGLVEVSIENVVMAAESGSLGQGRFCLMAQVVANLP